MNIRRGLAGLTRDQAEHLTTLAILVQNVLERRRITRLVIFGIEFLSMLPVIGFDFSLSLFYCEAEIRWFLVVVLFARVERLCVSQMVASSEWMLVR
jgi:hypothetical protein